jgi:hypothetical protein
VNRQNGCGRTQVFGDQQEQQRRAIFGLISASCRARTCMRIRPECAPFWICDVLCLAERRFNARGMPKREPSQPRSGCCAATLSATRYRFTPYLIIQGIAIVVFHRNDLNRDLASGASSDQIADEPTTQALVQDELGHDP